MSPSPLPRTASGRQHPANGSSAAAPAGEDADSFVKPKDGFHLSDLADFAVVQRAATAPAEAEDEAPVETVDAVARAPAPEFTAAEQSPSRARGCARTACT